MSRTAAICAIMKQEAPYIVEWVAWHRLLGFDIIIADNGGTDGQSELLARLDRAGLVKHLDVRHLRFMPQVPAYNLMLRYAASHGYDIVGFIDADEFFEPLGPGPLEGSGAALVRNLLAQGPRALAFNWMNFGSSHLTEPTAEPVMLRFRWAGRQDREINKHFKSFLAVGPVLEILETRRATKLHAHGAVIPAEYYSHDGGPADFDAEFGRCKSISWQHARIRHYMIKTFSEFLRGKDARGRADAKPGDLSYKQDYFQRFDMNDVEAPLSGEAQAKLREAIAEIDSAIGGTRADVRPPAVANAARIFWQARPFNGPGRGEAFDKGLRQAARSLRMVYFGGSR